MNFPDVADPTSRDARSNWHDLTEHEIRDLEGLCQLIVLPEPVFGVVTMNWKITRIYSRCAVEMKIKLRDTGIDGVVHTTLNFDGATVLQLARSDRTEGILALAATARRVLHDAVEHEIDEWLTFKGAGGDVRPYDPHRKRHRCG